MTNNIFTRKRVALLVGSGFVTLMLALGSAHYTSDAHAFDNTLTVYSDTKSEALSTTPVAIIYGADPTVITGSFENDTDEPVAVAIYVKDLDLSQFTPGELRATRVLSTVEVGLESNTVETSLGDFASTHTVSEQIGASSMEVDPGETFSYSVRITPPADGDPKLDRKPFTTNINLVASFQVRDSEEVGS